MHELPITESILKIVNEEADKNNVKKVISIKLVIGELTGILPECIQLYFDLISKGTKSEGAKLIINKVFVRKKCLICNSENEINAKHCKFCHSDNLKLTGGKEFFIESIEVE